jgi:hypothetical protein
MSRRVLVLCLVGGFLLLSCQRSAATPSGQVTPTFPVQPTVSSAEVQMTLSLSAEPVQLPEGRGAQIFIEIRNLTAQDEVVSYDITVNGKSFVTGIGLVIGANNKQSLSLPVAAEEEELHNVVVIIVNSRLPVFPSNVASLSF